MPAKEWTDQYAQVKEQLRCSVDLESYFLEKRIGDVDVDILEIGTVHFPTGQIVACDPLVDLEDSIPYLQEVPVGTGSDLRCSKRSVWRPLCLRKGSGQQCQTCPL